MLICTKKYRRQGILLLCGLAAGVLVGNVFLKNFVARPRPCWLDSSVRLLIANPTDYSFPSGHTLSSVIGATILTKTDRRFGYAAIPLAALIAFSRLYLYVHFPSDVLAAAVLGVLIGKVSDRVGMHLINWMEQVWKERTVH
ncbi:MAG: phosphatase PAP2 family protein [Oscillospiraceae bacterium]